MSIGLVGKLNGVRLVTGSVHYGKKSDESRNIALRKFPNQHRSRSVRLIGECAKQEIEYINSAPKKDSKKTVYKVG